MKGIFFTELLDLVEKEYGPVTTEEIVIQLGAGNQGVYDSGLVYPLEEFNELIHLLSKKVRLSVSDLYKNYGMYLFSRLVILYRPDFAANSDMFSFLEQMEHFIQTRIEYFTSKRIEGLTIERVGDHNISVSYYSRKDMIDLAIGLFMGCQKFFNEELILNTEFINENEGLVRFTLSKSKVLI